MPNLDFNPEHITVLSGGVGGARFLQGIQKWISQHESAATVSVIANTGDDIWLHGLKVCPDLDTVMYTLGDGIDTERGWGRKEETWHAKEELAAYGVQPDWFGLGDRDLATHLVRTQMLDAGYSLTDVTKALCQRWNPGVELLPMSDDRIETHVVVNDPEDGERKAIHFQEYWIRHQAQIPAEAVLQIGGDTARPTPAVLDAIKSADLIVLPPSNPVVSVGAILAVPGIRTALDEATAPIVGVSGIIDGDHVRGMARQLLEVIEVECSAAGVAEHYGARKKGGLLDGWLVDSVDADLLPRIQAAGIACAAAPLWMTSQEATASMFAAAIDLVSQNG
jgi:LPPG:FO 2-phospho-L-lactate transferase